MSPRYHLVTYTPAEERLNRITHMVAILASAIGLVLMVIAAARTGDPYRIVSSVVFGSILTAFYVVSTLLSLRSRQLGLNGRRKRPAWMSARSGAWTNRVNSSRH